MRLAMQIPFFLFGFFAVFLCSNSPIFSQENKPPSLVISPDILIVKLQSTHSVQIKGGLPPYRWFSTMGTVEKIDSNHFNYIAPRRYGNDKVTFEDRAGQQVILKIIIPRPLSISPVKMNIPVNGTGKFNVAGGSGKWEVIDNDAFSVTKITKNSFVLQTGSVPCNLNLKIKDIVTDDIQEITVNIYGSLSLTTDPKSKKNQ